MSPADFFSERVSFRGRMPLRWEPLESEPDEGQLSSLNEQNLALLRAVSALEERHSETPDNPQHVPLPDIQRLEAKLDLLLTLVGQIRSASEIVPPSRTLELSAGGLAWWPGGDEQSIRVDMIGLVEISLAAYAAQPLKLPVRVVSVTDWEDERVVLATFSGINATTADALEKLVFRHHRRAIAGSRGE